MKRVAIIRYGQVMISPIEYIPNEIFYNFIKYKYYFLINYYIIIVHNIGNIYYII